MATASKTSKTTKKSELEGKGFDAAETRTYRWTFITSLLGTLPADKEIRTNYVINKVADDAEKTIADVQDELDELKAMPDPADEIENKTTVFAVTLNGEPHLRDYQIKGYFKEACRMLRRAGKIFLSAGLSASVQRTHGLIHVKPRMVLLNVPEGSTLGICERPIRVKNQQGERVALARSQEAPVGTTVDFKVKCYDPSLFKYVEEWMTLGEDHGTGQWRTGGHGRFEWERTD